jgi:hypothetical protein
MKKKRFFIFVLLGIFLISSLSFAQPPYAGCPGPPNHEDGLIVVHNPLGQPPDKEMFSLAPRFDTLEGKTLLIFATSYSLHFKKDILKQTLYSPKKKEPTLKMTRNCGNRLRQKVRE